MITGGAGFIGHHLVKHYLETSDTEILVVDNLSVPESRDHVIEHPRVTMVTADINDVETLAPYFERHIDAVIHAAAESHVDHSIVDPRRAVMTNVMGTQALLELSRLHGVGRFLQVSTDEVYGVPSKKAFQEGDLLSPNNPYAAAKAGADHLVRAYHRTYGLDVVTTRSANTYGPGQAGDKLIPKMIRLAMRNEKLPLYGDGRQVREWVAVDDHVRAIALVLEKGAGGEVYNIPGTDRMENIHLVRRILSILGRSEALIDHVADRPGHDRSYAIDGSKLRALGYAPTRTFGEKLRETVDWYAGKWR